MVRVLAGYRGLLILACFLAGSASAATLNVPADDATIQAAIDAASDGDTVLVAPGTYYEQIDFKGKAITVKSSGGAVVTILDGNNVGPIVTFDIAEGNASVLQGFTLTHSYEAVALNNSSPTIEDNIFVDNVNAPPGGSAINAISSSPVLIRNYFLNNTGVIDHTTAIYAVVSFTAGNPVVADNVFVNNFAIALFVDMTTSAPQIYNNTFVGNVTAISTPVVTTDPSTAISNNLIAFNQVGVDVTSAATAMANFTNNLVYDNVTANYTGVATDQTGSHGNISAAPELKDWGNGDVHLLSNSPAIDAGDGTVTQVSATDFYGNTRVFGGVVDIGAAESVAPDSSQPASTIINVPTDQPTIQAGIDASHNTYTVVVAAGTYYEKLDFKGKAITVRSSRGAAFTILDGNKSGPIVWFHNSEPNAAVLQGFTLTHASFNSDSGGSAVILTEASPTIEDNVFVDNYDGIDLNTGSAIHGFLSSAVVIRNRFANNTGLNVEEDNLSSVVGLVGASPVVADNVFVNNSSIALEMEVTQGGPQVYNNTVVGNLVGLAIPVAELSYQSGTLFSNNLIAFNQVGVTMALPTDLPPPTFTNNLVFGDTTADYTSVMSQTGTNGNISVNPKLKNWTSGDVHLLFGSPAIDAGDGTVTQTSATDFYGKARVSPGTPTGSPVVDIGAAEYQPLLASDGSLSTTPDRAVGKVIRSETADTGEQLEMTVLTHPQHGTVAVSATDFRYSPAAGYVGTDSFTFTLTDPFGATSNIATEQVTVIDAPARIPNSSFSVRGSIRHRGAPVVHKAYPEQTLTFALAAAPQHGVVAIDVKTGAYLYQANRGFKGQDSFTVQVTDQYGNASNIATITAEVL